MTEPLTPARLDEIELIIPEAYTAPWTVHPGDDGEWLVGYATENPLAGLVATVPDYGMYLAEFIATARTAIPELLAEVTRLRTELAQARSSALREGATVLEALADHVEARVLAHYNGACGAGSCDMVRESARTLRELADGLPAPVAVPAAGEAGR